MDWFDFEKKKKIEGGGDSYVFGLLFQIVLTLYSTIFFVMQIITLWYHK